MDHHEPSDRDSHDLSLPARFSVVDNMLLSLSDLSAASPAAPHARDARPMFDDPALKDLYALSATNSPTMRTVGGGTAPYRNLTYPPTSDDLLSSVHGTIPGYPSQQGRNLQKDAPAILRSNSLEQSGRRSHTEPNGQQTSDETDATTGTTAKHTRGAVVKNSMGSISSSMDLGSPRAGTRFFPLGRDRATSFDYGAGDRRPAPLTIKVPNAATQSAVPSNLDDIDDAAPTPTVLPGPRRAQDPMSPLIGSQPPTPKKSHLRRNSVKSTAAKVKKKADTMDASVREQARQFVNASNSVRGQNTSGQTASPLTGSGSRRNSTHPNAQANKEQRPGFFRRLFGSSKATEEERNIPSPSFQHTTPLSSSMERPKTQPSQQSRDIHSRNRPPTQDTTGSKDRTTPGTQTLKKSHSSFFRRRKKSMSEPACPPLPTDFATHQIEPSTPPRPMMAAQSFSPESNSLRQAMDPYLNEITSSPTDLFFDSRERQSALLENGVAGETDHRRLAGRSSGPDPSQRFNTDSIYAPRLGVERIVPAAKAESTPFVHAQPGDQSLHAASAKLGAVTSASLSNAFRREKSPDRRPPPPPTSDDPVASAQQTRVMPSPLVTSRLDELVIPHFDGKVASGAKQQLFEQSNHKRDHLDNSERVSELDVPLEATIGGTDDYVVSPVSKSGANSVRSLSSRSNRVWLGPTASEENLHTTVGNARTAQAEQDTKQRFTSPAPLVQTSGSSRSGGNPSITSVDDKRDDKSKQTHKDLARLETEGYTNLTPEDRDRAGQIFSGDETFLLKSEAAAWLGQTSLASARTRRAYMELFDWTGCNILNAFRELCSRLIVKAESQQLDRVIDAFSDRWCACNPNHGFKDKDVVHTITYSILMLNTDLHMADMEQRMSRSQFVKNTLPTIRSIADIAARSAPAQSGRAPSRQNSNIETAFTTSPLPGSGFDRRASEDRQSFEVKRSRGRLSVVRHDSDGPFDFRSAESCNVLVNKSHEGTMKGWELQVEIVLKDFYASIRAQKLPLHGASDNLPRLREEASSNSLSVAANNVHRSPSVMSKTPSENISYRSKPNDFRFGTGRFSSRNRSKQRVYPSSTIGSSRTSLDDQSVFSPAGSSWSRYSMGKTHTTMSMESLGSRPGQGDYQQAIGFANALSQAIIREESGTVSSLVSDEYAGRPIPMLEDDTLELAGPPWAKEGIVKHRHHLESVDKKAKSRDWNECFAVIEKGWMRLFSFNSTSTKSTKTSRARSKSKSSVSGPSAIVGGGNWSEKAEALGQFLLRQTIASALPPPGFSKTRPHVFALSLPTGAVHLFSVGTAEIVKEFVATANYWSARLSKEPLIGGVSNIEYGWSEAVIHAAQQQMPLGSSGTDSASFTRGHTPRQSSSHSIPTIHSGLGRSSTDQGMGGVGLSSSKNKNLPGDKVQISEWQPPTNSMMASNLMEVDQLRALTAYVQNVEEELRGHNELRSLMSLAYSPRQPNASKAMHNWEKKSAYLLREIVKFRTYIDSLEATQKQKEKIYKEREDRANGQSQQSSPKRASTAPSPGITGPSNTYVSGLMNARKPSFASIVSRSTMANSDDRTGAVTRASVRSSSGIGMRPVNEPELLDAGDVFDDEDEEGMDEATREAIAASRNASRVDLRTRMDD